MRTTCLILVCVTLIAVGLLIARQVPKGELRQSALPVMLWQVETTILETNGWSVQVTYGERKSVMACAKELQLLKTASPAGLLPSYKIVPANACPCCGRVRP